MKKGRGSSESVSSLDGPLHAEPSSPSAAAATTASSAMPRMTARANCDHLPIASLRLIADEDFTARPSTLVADARYQVRRRAGLSARGYQNGDRVLSSYSSGPRRE
jgi:hypothetical protein